MACYSTEAFLKNTKAMCCIVANISPLVSDVRAAILEQIYRFASRIDLTGA